MTSAIVKASLEVLQRCDGLAREAGWRPAEWIVSAELAADARYLSVAPEAFPFVGSGADGCHYALWVDDLAQEFAPAIVWVTPADGHAIHLVAADVDHFVALVRENGLWPAESRRAKSARDLAHRTRRALSRHPTVDGLGVVCGPEPAFERPKSEKLGESISRLLLAGAPGLALAMARDAIATSDVTRIDRFAESSAAIYRALGRELLAEIAERSYR